VTSEERDPVPAEPEPARTQGEGSRSSASLPGAATQPAAQPAAKGRKHLPVWQETILLLAVALLLAVGIKAFLAQAFYIPSESMEPGLVENDRILVQKPSYWGDGTPQRGDVVVFKDPGGWLGPEPEPSPLTALLTKVGLYPEGGHLVKRVVGVEGDVIACCDKQGRLRVNGEPVDESVYARPGDCFGPMIGCTWTAGPVPDGQLFVMGDNRAQSADSTVHLCRANETECSDSPWVDEDLVVGRVMAVIWPLDKARWERRPDVFAAVPEPGAS
jgi:signal peptidase I